MPVPTNLTEALALLTAADADKITGQDLRDVVTWLVNGAGSWTMLDTVGLIFWGKGIQDPVYRTMNGTRCDALLNPTGSGLDMLRTTGTPTIIASGGRNVFRSAGTSDISCASGGPIGNEPFWIKVLTLGDDTTFGEFIRVGSRGALANPDPSCGVGVTIGAEFGAGRLAAEGVPRGAQPGPIANGQARSVTAQHLPAFGKLTVGIDGRAPRATSGSTWAYSKVYNLDGSFALGATIAAATANTSGILDFVIGRGVLSAIDEARIDDAWAQQFPEVTRLPGELISVGDSITNGDDLASPTTERFGVQILNAINAAVVDQLVGFKNSLGGKRVGGDWLTGNPAMTFQCSGQYQVFVDVGDQGIHYSIPFQRTGRSRLQIVNIMGLTNDIVSLDITTMDAIGRLKACCYSVHQTGAYVALWSTILGSAGFWTPTKEAKRQAVIAWVRDQSVAEGFADFAINSEDAGLIHPDDFVAIMPEGNVHPNLAGHTKLAVLGAQKHLEFLAQWEAAGSPAIRPARGLAP